MLLLCCRRRRRCGSGRRGLLLPHLLLLEGWFRGLAEFLRDLILSLWP